MPGRARDRIALIDPGVPGLGLVDRDAFSVDAWARAARAAGLEPHPVAADAADGLAALRDCPLAVSLGDGLYPERRGALVAAVVARWVRDGGVLVDACGASFFFARLGGALAPRWAAATDLLEVVAGAACAERAIRPTPEGRDLLGPVEFPPTLLAANAGSARRLALHPAPSPRVSLVETDRGECLLGAYAVGDGFVVRWASAVQRPLAAILPAALLRLALHVRRPRGARSGPAVVLDPVLTRTSRGVRVGVAVFDAGGPLAGRELRLELRTPRRAAVFTHALPAATPGAWVGEFEIPLRPRGPADLSASLDGAAPARAVAETERRPGGFPRGAAPPERPADFAGFWRAARAELDRTPADVAWSPLPGAATAGVVAERVAFTGLDGVRTGGVLCRPERAARPAPAVLVLPGYTCAGMDELPERLAARGVVALAVDVRGVGSRGGLEVDGEGLLTHGLERPERHAYRGGLMDGARGLDLLAAHPAVDARRLAVTGVSQGGGLALALGSLDRRVVAAAALAPFLIDILRSSRLVDTEPLAELNRWLRAHPARAERAAATLQYFDAANFVQDLACPVFVGYSPADGVAPAAGVLTALRRLRAPVTVRRYAEGHMAPALLRHRDAADRWLLRALRAPR